MRFLIVSLTIAATMYYGITVCYGAKGVNLSGVDEAKNILSVDNATNPRGDVSKESSLIYKWKGNLGTNLNAVMGEETNKMYTLDGNRQVDAKIACAGNNKIAEITYTNRNKTFDTTITVSDGNLLRINGIRGVCSDSFTICDKQTNQRLCSASIRELTDTERKTHPCFNSYKCLNWKFLVQNRKLITEVFDHGACPIFNEAGGEQYESLTKQIILVLSNEAFAAISGVDTSEDGTRVAIYSQYSDQCVGRKNMFGSGLNSMAELGSLYTNGALQLPDGKDELAKQARDEDSLYNLISKGTQIEYEPGASIGSFQYDKCEIINTVAISSEETSLSKKIIEAPFTMCADHTIFSRITRDHSYIYFEFLDAHTSGGFKAHDNCPILSQYPLHEGWYQVHKIPVSGTDIRDIRMSFTINGENCNSGGGSASLNGPSLSDVVCSAPGGQWPTVSWFYEFDYAIKKTDAELSASNSCETLEKRSDCKIRAESVCNHKGVDCVETSRDKKSTGESFKNYCYYSEDGSVKNSICANGEKIRVSNDAGLRKDFVMNEGLGWFVIKREYECVPQNTGLFKDIDNLTKITDKTGDISDSIGISDNCYDQTCTISKTFNIDNIYSDGSTNGEMGNGASIGSEIRKCVPKNGNFKTMECPLNNNPKVRETVTKNCSCNDEDQMSVNLQDVLTGIALIENVKKSVCGDNASK